MIKGTILPLFQDQKGPLDHILLSSAIFPRQCIKVYIIYYNVYYKNGYYKR